MGSAPCGTTPRGRADASRTTATGYRPWLDGVRAVAVLMVAVQHTMGEMPIDLGFVGVGIFFALSGYLITGLLLDEHDGHGSVSLSRFYLRRAARLVPALVVVVTVCDALFLLEGDRAPIRATLFALTYTANYAEIVGGDVMRGYGPTWSLAVEEHFYLLWPLALLLVLRHRRLDTALRVTLAACGAAFVWRTALALLRAPYTLIGIGSLERADAMLFGCAAAMAVRLGWRPARWMVWTAAGALSVLPMVFARETYPALVVGNAVLAIAGALLVAGLDHAAPEWMRRWLSVPVLAGLGVVSYGVYLWHGPLMRVAANAGYAGRGWRALVVLTAVAAATTSYLVIEAPIRAWARRRTSATLGSGSNTRVAAGRPVPGPLLPS